MTLLLVALAVTSNGEQIKEEDRNRIKETAAHAQQRIQEADAAGAPVSVHPVVDAKPKRKAEPKNTISFYGQAGTTLEKECLKNKQANVQSTYTATQIDTDSEPSTSSFSSLTNR